MTTLDPTCIRESADEEPMRPLFEQVATMFGVACVGIREDGTSLRTESSAAPAELEHRDRIAPARSPTHFQADNGWVRLVVPIWERRRLWGHLVASFLPVDALTGRPGPGLERLYTRAAAPRLLEAIAHQVDSRRTNLLLDTELEELSDKLLESYEEITLLFRLGNQFNINTPPDDVVAQSCRELRQLLGPERTVACLTILPAGMARREPSRIPVPTRRSTARDTEPVFRTEGPIPLGADRLHQWLERYRGNCVDWGRPLVANQGNGVPEFGMEFGRLMMAPLCYQSELLGLLVAVADASSREFDSRDIQILANVATHTAAHWRNYLLYCETKDLLYSLVRALVSAIDAKDPYTHGHSERVARISRKIGERLGHEGRDLEADYLSGLLHDVGKIGVREEVLGKTTALNAAEWAHLRRHPVIGAKILAPVPAIAHVLPAVLHHHESWDGQGYPSRLAGEEIPLLARIVAVADTFDALSSDRPYRTALSLEQVRSLFEHGAGVQWDEKLVEIMLRLLDSPHFLGEYATLQEGCHAGTQRAESTADWMTSEHTG